MKKERAIKATLIGIVFVCCAAWSLFGYDLGKRAAYKKVIDILTDKSEEEVNE